MGSNWQPFMEDGTRKERTCWRDQDISLRHRMWGVNCPAVDLDFLLVEYNTGLPVCFIEYKHNRTGKMVDLSHPSYRAIGIVARLANLPFAIVYYRTNPFGFMAEPVNDLAAKWFTKYELLSEFEYVTKLYAMRGNSLSKHLSESLNRDVPNPYDFARVRR